MSGLAMLVGIDLHGGSHTATRYAIGHLIDVDAHRHALARRTREKIGFTEAKPCLSGWAFGMFDPAGDAPTWPRTSWL